MDLQIELGWVLEIDLIWCDWLIDAHLHVWKSSSLSSLQINPSGAAARDGRLKIGLRILEVWDFHVCDWLIDWLIDWLFIWLHDEVID